MELKPYVTNLVLRLKPIYLFDCSVFAHRLNAKNKRWDSYRKCYIWDRLPTAIRPQLPQQSTLAQTLESKKTIDWPVVTKREVVPGMTASYLFLDISDGYSHSQRKI